MIVMYPEKIVCLAAEIPEILFELGALDRVVGISAYTTRPAEALQIPKVSGFQYGSVERILKVEPDLVIVTSGVQKKLAAELAERGVTIVHVNPHRLEDMFETILLLGNIVEEAKRAEQYVQQLRGEIAYIQEQSASFSYRPRVYFEEWMDPLIVGTAWVSDLIEIAGGQDVFREKALAGRTAASRVVTPEQVISANPEIILASWCGKPFKRDEFVAREGFFEISAVRRDRVLEVNGEILQCGPMLIDSLRAIHEMVKDFL